MTSDEHGRDRVTRPILAERILHTDGTRAVGLRVFCARRRSSLSLDECRRCTSHLEVIERSVSGAEGAIQCGSPDLTPSVWNDDAGVPVATPREGIVFPVGAILRVGSMCVEIGVSADVVLRFPRSPEESLLVVDLSGRLVGIIRKVRVAPAKSDFPRWEALRIVEQALGLRSRPETAEEMMSSPVAVQEGAPLREAISRMARLHLRAIPVVAADGTPIGILSDIEALRAFARSR